jgi:hypothetical protein
VVGILVHVVQTGCAAHEFPHPVSNRSCFPWKKRPDCDTGDFLPIAADVNNDPMFEVFTAVTMKNAVFLDVTPCGSCKNRRSGESSACKLVPSTPIVVTLMMETLRSSATSVLKEPHGVTSQKTAFFNNEISINSFPHMPS